MAAVWVILLSAICGVVQSSEFHSLAPAGAAPVVTAASSQYFERTFNRLVAAPAVQPVLPVAPPPVVVDANTPITPAIPAAAPADPDVAIAVATAHAAAPVATILLPPYPFGIPPTLGFYPSAPPFNVPSENPNKESTTQKTTSTVQTTTTEKDLEVAPLPSNNDNSFAQALPSDESGNVRPYPPPPAPLAPPAPGPPRPAHRPQATPRLPLTPLKLQTTVEVVPVPLTYIAPPPMLSHAHVHPRIHPHGRHAHVKLLKHAHFHTYIPKKTKIVIRPIRIHAVRVPARLLAYEPLARSSAAGVSLSGLRARGPGEPEPTTVRPFNRPMTKPPRL